MRRSVAISGALSMALLFAVVSQQSGSAPRSVGLEGRGEARVAGAIPTPGDPVAAAGPTRLLAVDNATYALFDRAGSTLTSVATGGLASLTGSNTLEPNNFASRLTDPAVGWDPLTNRFYYVVLDAADGALAFGFSKTASPSGTSDFCRYWRANDYSGGTFGDFPRIGSTAGNILIGVERVDASEQYLASDVLSFRKPPGGSATIATCPTYSSGDFARFLNVGSRTPIPAWQVDPFATGEVVMAADPSTGSASTVRVVPFTDGVTGLPVLGTATSINVTSYRRPAPAPQPSLGGATWTLDAGDARFFQAISAVDPTQTDSTHPLGRRVLWTAHAVARSSGTGAEVRWYEIDAEAGSVKRSGTVGAAGRWYLYPTIAPDRAWNGGSPRFGDGWVLAFNTVSATSDDFLAIRTVRGRGGTTEATTGVVVQSAGVNYDITCTATTPCRWGDYGGVGPDPLTSVDASSGGVWFNALYTVASGIGVADVDWRSFAWRTAAPPQAARTPSRLAYTGSTAGTGGSAATISAKLDTTGGTAIANSLVAYAIRRASGVELTNGTGVTSSQGTISTSWAPPAGDATTYTIAVTFAGNASYLPSSVTGSLNVKAATAVGSIGPTSAAKSAAVTWRATVTSGGTGIAGLSVAFTLGKTALGSAVTDATGVARLAGTAPSKAGSYTLGASVAATATYAASSSSATVTVQ